MIHECAVVNKKAQSDFADILVEMLKNWTSKYKMWSLDEPHGERQGTLERAEKFQSTVIGSIDPQLWNTKEVLLDEVMLEME